MKHSSFYILAILISLTSLFGQAQVTPNNSFVTPGTAQHLKWAQEQLRHPKTSKVLISAHRGDWRHAPENSMQSLKQSILKQYDIVECDLKMSKDKHIIIMHDNTIDRTTNGKGKPEDYTLAELKSFKLKSGSGHITRHEIPTLEEYLMESKGKAMLCLDKGFEHFDAAMKLVKQYDMADQIIFNVPSVSLDSLKRMQLEHLDDKLVLNVLGFPQDTLKANILKDSYKARGCVIFHPTFNSDTIPLLKWLPTIRKNGIHLWLNALWPEHNAGHDDDTAVEQNKPEETWGWLITQGATIIQTDRPEELLQYLKRKKLRP
jgi:glycerophosphoryl diester phosphodiesterase